MEAVLLSSHQNRIGPYMMARMLDVDSCSFVPIFVKSGWALSQLQVFSTMVGTSTSLDHLFPGARVKAIQGRTSKGNLGRLPTRCRNTL